MHEIQAQARCGADVEWIAEIDYDVDLRRADGFYRAIRDCWLGFKDGQPVPEYGGLRPKLAGPDQPASDFLIQSPHEHGVAGLINLSGIESLGLTASLALVRQVAQMAHRV